MSTSNKSTAPTSASPGLLPRRISPRDLADYRQCPRRVWFRRIARVEPRERANPTLMLGSAVHSALDTFFGLRAGDREPVEETLHRCLRTVWRKHRAPDTFLTREEEADYGQQGLRLLSDFAQHFDTSAAPLARERWVSVRLPNGVELFGKVDRVDGDIHPDRKGTLEVIDYKTGRATLEDEDVSDEPAAQVYLLASEDEYGREVSRVRFLYLATGGEARWEPEREDVEAARERLLELTNIIYRDRAFEARPGDHCSRCVFAHICPEAGRVELADLDVDAHELPF
jgi:putative RecB family exonuclease